jgi:hypothetical protein
MLELRKTRKEMLKRHVPSRYVEACRVEMPGAKGRKRDRSGIVADV